MIEVDALVIGGGPAGATAAGLLASWGRSVVLVHHDPGQPSLAESLPASTRKLLRFLGLQESVDHAGFHPNHGNLSCWAGKTTAATSADAGYHVSRRRFDHCLREHARTSGASVVDGHVQRVKFGKPPHITVVDTSGGAADYTAGMVLDCSGRSGVIARKGLRRLDAGYRTLAVAAEWESECWREDERAHTIVDSYEDGWAWSVPLSPSRRQCTVMIDHERTPISRTTLSEVYRAELQKASGIAARVTAARQVGDPWACDATLYRSVRTAEDRALLVGDAASFIEPLSSAGVKKAITSAWRAAVVANTCLENSTMWSVAADFYDRREQLVYRECLERSASFFREAASFHRDPFWETRAACRLDGALPPGGELTDRQFAGDPAVREAFEGLRAGASGGFAASSGLRFEMAPVIEGRKIELREAIVIPGVESPARFAAGVNLPALIRIATDCADPGAILQAYQNRIGEADPHDVLLALSLLIARGTVKRI
jgi:flavin-dependent dehydrogenase